MKQNPKDEKFTPRKYLKSVRKVLGQIDLDPFSCYVANERVRATKFFNKEDNGFKQDWFGKVFANPPYSRGNLNHAVIKILQEWNASRVKEGIYLFPNSTDTKWFQPLWSYPICFTDHRIAFINGHTEKVEDNPENGSVFVYSGFNIGNFYSEFEKYGHIVLPH